MIQLVPIEPISHYNLGALYKQADKSTKPSSSSRRAAELDPNLAAPHFQLYNIYRQQGRKQTAAKELAEFQALKKAQEGAVTPEDMEWSDYAEIYDPIDIKDGHPPGPGPRFPCVRSDRTIGD